MKAVILFSGGADSTVLLALAKQQERECLALSFDYGQRHRIELEAARRIAAHYHIHHHIITLDSATFSRSALLSGTSVPTGRSVETITAGQVPSTYVPARNTLFLSYALGYAESSGAQEIYFGANLMDRNAYPDCTPAFVSAFQQLINVACKQPPVIVTPLMDLDKVQIFELADRLQAPLDMSWSCYNPQDGVPCKQCDACVLRQEATAQLARRKVLSGS